MIPHLLEQARWIGRALCRLTSEAESTHTHTHTHLTTSLFVLMCGVISDGTVKRCSLKDSATGFRKNPCSTQHQGVSLILCGDSLPNICGARGRTEKRAA